MDGSILCKTTRCTTQKEGKHTECNPPVRSASGKQERHQVRHHPTENILSNNSVSWAQRTTRFLLLQGRRGLAMRALPGASWSSLAGAQSFGPDEVQAAVSCAEVVAARARAGGGGGAQAGGTAEDGCSGAGGCVRGRAHQCQSRRGS